MNQIKKDEILQAAITYTVMIFIGFASYSFLQLFSPLSAPEKPPTKPSGSILTGSISTGTTSTGSFTRDDYIKILTGTGLSTIESKVQYVLSFGESNRDFVTITPHNQDVILGANKDTNNVFLQSFIQKYQYPFTIDKNRTGYLVIQTQKPISNKKDMILAINGMRLGSFHKTADLKRFMSDVSHDPLDPLYIFPVKNIDIAQQIGMVDLTTFNQLNMAVVIGENNNTVTSLSIVYTE